MAHTTLAIAGNATSSVLGANTMSTNPSVIQATFRATGEVKGTNTFRETRSDREARKREMAKQGTVTFIARLEQLPVTQQTALLAGHTIAVGNLSLTINKPETLRCEFCHGVHGKPTKKDILAGDTSWGNTIWKTGVFRQGERYFLASESCVLGTPDGKTLPLWSFLKFSNDAELATAYGVNLPAKPLPKKS